MSSLYHSERLPSKTLIFSFVLLVASLTQNAFAYHDVEGNHQLHATEAAFMGAIAVFGGGILEWIIWFANPLALLGLVFILVNNRNAKKCITLAIALALSFIFWDNVLITFDGSEVTIIRLGAGYWLWLASLCVLRVAASMAFKTNKRRV